MPCKSTPNLVAFTLAQAGVPVEIEGEPGGAKTFSWYAFAKALNRGIYTIIGSLREPADIGGYPFVRQSVEDPGTGKRTNVYMEMIPPRWAMDCWDGQKWIVFFDERNCSAPAVQAAMLRVMAEGVVGDFALPRSTWFVSAINPPEQAANAHETSAAMANRMAHIKWQPPINAALDGFAGGLHLNKDGVPRFSFDDPEFIVVPGDWWKGADAIGNKARAFLHAMPALAQKCPESSQKASGAWPSPRSWELAIRGDAAMEAIDASKELRFEAMQACVGFEAANSYAVWLDKLDLPDIETEISRAQAAHANGVDYTLPDLRNRQDVAWAFFGGICQQACVKQLTQQRFEATGVIFREMWKQYKEVTIACSRPYGLAAAKHPDWWFPVDALVETHDLLAEAGAWGNS
jgi:hypothetical protein